MSVDTVPNQLRFEGARDELRNWLESKAITRPLNRNHIPTYRYIGTSGNEYQITRTPHTIEFNPRGDNVTIVTGDHTDLHRWDYVDFEGVPNQAGTAFRELSYLRTEEPYPGARYQHLDQVSYLEFGNYRDRGRGSEPEINDRYPGPRDIRTQAEAIDVFVKFGELQKDLDKAVAVQEKGVLAAVGRFGRDHRVHLAVPVYIGYKIVTVGALVGVINSLQNLDAWNVAVNLAALYTFDKISTAAHDLIKPSS